METNVTAVTEHEAGGKERVVSILPELHALLEEERRRIADEIAHYPPPIPRCDAQYNALLEERAAVAEALHRLDALGRTGGDEARVLIAELGAATDSLPGAAAERVRALLARV